MKKLMNTRLFWMIVSLLLSFVLWVYVTSVVEDEISRTFTGVSVELVGTQVIKDSKSLVITDLSTNTVSVNISGPRRVVAGLSKEQLSAQIDVSKLSQAGSATMSYSILFPSGINSSGLTVSRKVPDTVSFTVSRLISKEIPVRGSFDGNTAEGYTSLSPVFEPSTITVTGPAETVNEISYAWVTFSAKDVSSTYSEETGFGLFTEDKQAVDMEGLTCSTDVVKATLPILMVKDVKLSVNTVYGAGANENNVIVTIVPDTIPLAGDSAILNGLNKVILGTVDLTSFESTFEEVYPITIDNDLQNLTGVTEAHVTVEVVGLKTETFKVTNISYENLTEGYKAEMESVELQVRIRGTEEQLKLLKAENIRAVADLTDYNETTGSQIVPVKIYVDGVTDVGAIGSYSVSMTISKENK